MSGSPRVKRLFQPSINSYFHVVVDENATHAPQSTNNPILPDTVQSSLLNVGMRVRKAVPGGYRHPLSSKTQAGSPPLTEISPNGGGGRELQPLCGLNKVGGYLEAPAGPFRGLGAAPHAGLVTEDELFASSQESSASTVSTDSVPSRVQNAQPREDRKRSHGDCDDETPEEEGGMRVEHTPWPLWSRRMARAVTRRQPRRLAATAAPVPMDTSDDFEDAPFLMPRE